LVKQKNGDINNAKCQKLQELFISTTDLSLQYSLKELSGIAQSVERTRYGQEDRGKTYFSFLQCVHSAPSWAGTETL